MISNLLCFLLGSGLMVLLFYYVKRFKPQFDLKEHRIKELDNLILNSKAEVNRIESLRNRGLEKALSLRMQSKINLIIGFSLTVVVISITYLIPALTLAQSAVDVLVPWLDIQIITALLASVAGLLGAINAFANFLVKSKELENRSNYILAELWKYVSFVDDYHEDDPHKSAGLAIEHIEEALKKDMTYFNMDESSEATNEINYQLRKSGDE